MMIRRMEERDLNQVCAIENDMFSMPWTQQSFLDSLLILDNIYLVAEKETSIVGYCGVWVIANEGQINNIAVKKEYQNQGIGKQILQFLFREGQKKQIQQFTLEVRKSNQIAILLYQTLGFVNLGIRPNFYERPKEDAVIMTVITYRKDEITLV
ncbi:MAG: ribosomal protein S18-alanine N-acetyltransferase [Velocimicrobium sp.]